MRGIGVLLTFAAFLFAGCATRPAPQPDCYLVIDDVASGEDRSEGLKVAHSIAIPLREGRSYHFEDADGGWSRQYDGKFRTNSQGKGEITFRLTEAERAPAKVSEFKIILQPENPVITGPYYAPPDNRKQNPVYRSMTLSASPAPRQISQMNFR